MGHDDERRTDDIHESTGPNTAVEDLREEARLADAEAGEHWEMTGEGATPVPDTGVEPRMDADGAHVVAQDGLRSEMTAEGAQLEPDDGTDTRMTGAGAIPAGEATDAKHRTDR
jgi:hypothetical protein